MKRIFLFITTALLFAGGAVAQDAPKEKVAIYTTDKSDKNVASFVGTYLTDAIVKRGKYAAVERTSDFLRALSKEQGYQRTGAVDDNQISALGKQFGVQLVCVVEVSPMSDGGGQLYMSARLVDVQSAIQKATSRPVRFNIDEIEMACDDLVGSMFGYISGLLYVSANTPAHIYINDNSTGKTTPDRMSLPIGSYTLSLQADDYQTFMQQVTVEEGKTAKVEAKLQKNKKLIDPHLFFDYRGSITAPGGFGMGYCKRFGGYFQFHLRNASAGIYDSDYEGSFDNSKREYIRLSITGGAMLCVSKWLYLYGGLGFGKYGVGYFVKSETEQYTTFEGKTKSSTKKYFYCPSLIKGLEVECGMKVVLGKALSLSVGYSALPSSKFYGELHFGAGILL